MGRVVERNQNPVVGDTLMLRIVVYNSNNYNNVEEIEKVDIFFVEGRDKDKKKDDCGECCEKRHVMTVTPDQVVMDSTGNYSIALATSTPTFVPGRYEDVWSMIFRNNDPTSSVTNNFKLYSDLWYTATTPAVYGFDFKFQPNRIRHGSKKWLHVRIDPNVPTATDLMKYYTNLAIGGDLFIYIEQVCGPCTNPERDLRLIVDRSPVIVRDGVFGHYFFQTEDLDCGIYNVWFELDYAGTVEISNKNQLQIL